MMIGTNFRGDKINLGEKVLGSMSYSPILIVDGEKAPPALMAEGITNGIDDLTGGGHYAEKCEGTSINHGLAIHQDLEFPVSSMGGINLGAEFAAHAGRHTDGVDTRDSVGTISDSDASHRISPASGEAGMPSHHSF
jgi:hypothetical protein